MKKTISDILGGKLPDDLVESINDAFEQRIAESRSELEAEIREDFARRYDADRNRIVSAIDSMLSEKLREHVEEKATEIEKLTEARVKYHTAMVEGRKAVKGRLSESMDVINKLVTTKLTAEIGKLHEARADAARKARKLAEDVKAAKIEIAEQHAAHVTKIDEFVTRQVSKELKEFAADAKALNESRVRLVSESRQKLKETQARFVKEAAKKVDALVTESLRANLAELHEDLERNRQNMFGRRIFEAVAGEFMTSYLAEGTEIRKLQKVLESRDAEIAAIKESAEQANNKIMEAEQVAEQAGRKARLAEERAERTKIMSEMLATLKGEKRSIMENLLSSTKTAELRKSFDKLLPMVLAEGRQKSPAVLSETAKTPRVASRPVTGDAGRSNRIFEAHQEDDQQEIAEIARMKLNAGIKG